MCAVELDNLFGINIVHFWATTTTTTNTRGVEFHMNLWRRISHQQNRAPWTEKQLVSKNCQKEEASLGVQIIQVSTVIV